MIESATYSLKQAFVSSTQDTVATVGQAQSRGGDPINQDMVEVKERIKAIERSREQQKNEIMQRLDNMMLRQDQLMASIKERFDKLENSSQGKI